MQSLERGDAFSILDEFLNPTFLADTGVNNRCSFWQGCFDRKVSVYHATAWAGGCLVHIAVAYQRPDPAGERMGCCPHRGGRVAARETRAGQGGLRRSGHLGRWVVGFVQGVAPAGVQEVFRVYQHLLGAEEHDAVLGLFVAADDVAFVAVQFQCNLMVRAMQCGEADAPE